MGYETLEAEIKNGVQWIRLNRPDKLNAFNEQMGVDLLEALKEGERSLDARCLVLTGTGRAFSVGEDLNTNRGTYESGKPMLLGEVLKRKYNPIVQRIRKMDKPVVGAINGVTAGAGLGLALACDLRAASERATFHEAFIKVGLSPDSGTSFWLTRILGLAKAMEVGMLGEPIDANMALNLGLVNWVFPEDKFSAEVARIAERLASGPTRALALQRGRSTGQLLWTWTLPSNTRPTSRTWPARPGTTWKACRLSSTSGKRSSRESSEGHHQSLGNSLTPLTGEKMTHRGERTVRAAMRTTVSLTPTASATKPPRRLPRGMIPHTRVRMLAFIRP